jgi:hypothetical protein
MIKSLEDRKHPGKIEIDLSGPEGNAYNLLGIAERLAIDLSMDAVEIIAEMTSGDYDNLVEVFDKNFGDFVILWR